MAQLDSIQEASDPATDPERLRELAYHQDKEVRRAVQRNPSVSEEVWRRSLLNGEPEAWANPMAPLYLLAWTPRDNVQRAALLAMGALWRNPERCSLEGKVLLAAKVQEEWATSESAANKISLLGRWAQAKGNGSPEHRTVVRILVMFVLAMPNLTAQDREALDILEAWTAGDKNLPKKAKTLADFKAIKDIVLFTSNTQHSPWNVLYHSVDTKEGPRTKAEYERLLADLIRREMPLPPVVE